MKKHATGAASAVLALSLIFLCVFTACDLNITIDHGGTTSGPDDPETTLSLSPDTVLPETGENDTGASSSDPVSTSSATESSSAASETSSADSVTTLPEVTTAPETTQEATAPEVTTSTETSPETTSSDETLPLTEPDVTSSSPAPVGKMALIEAESFVNTMGVNGLLLSEFTDVRDACLWPVVAELKDDGIPASTDIQALYAKNGKVYSEYMGDNTVRASFLNSKLLEWTGFTAKDFKSYGDKDPVYLASADYYSAQFGGVIFSKATIVKVETDSRNGLYYIYYTPSEIMGNEWYIEYNSELSSATLMLLCADWIDGHFVIVSNQAIWSSYGGGNSASIFKSRVEKGLKAPGLRGLLRDDFQEDYFFNGNLPRVFSADIFAFVATYQGSGLDVEYDYPKVYAENGLTYYDDTGVIGVPGNVIRDDILRYTGYDIDTFMNNPQVERKPNYLATVDVYSAQFGGLEGGMPANVEVEWVDNVYHVTYVDAFDATHRNEAYLKLNWDGSYQIMANKIIKGMG